ncbi:MAG: hybrid sensor histidine kinase/response regulator [Anaerolinea sp.]|nr:hybrid sensor histidine kinase/response regulator [Anaerolinea sp.]
MDSKGRILVVEDDVNLLKGIRTVLELDGYEVITAENGAIALDWLQRAPAYPDLIVSDIMMPHMDGLQLLQQVRSVPEWLGIPFIFLTARTDKADVQLSKLMGVDDHLSKPFEAAELLVAVESRMKRLRDLRAVHAHQISDIKRKILTILNHEFRTPLTFVVAYSDLLNLSQQENPQMNDQEMLTFLKGINLGAVRLRRLIENFILLVELETGEAQSSYQMRRAPITDIAALLKDAREVALDGRLERVIEIEDCRHLSARLGDRFIADSDFLQRALVQLLDNAIKFSPPQTVVRMGAEADDAEVRLWVQDFGRGIPPAEIDQIWECFYQINRDVYEDPGAGSGLAIVRGIVQLHGGHASVQSVPGQGSIFTLHLPLQVNT